MMKVCSYKQWTSCNVSFSGCIVSRDCQDYYEQGHTCNGIYTIKPDHLPAFKVSIIIK